MYLLRRVLIRGALFRRVLYTSVLIYGCHDATGAARGGPRDAVDVAAAERPALGVGHAEGGLHARHLREPARAAAVGPDAAEAAPSRGPLD